MSEFTHVAVAVAAAGSIKTADLLERVRRAVAERFPKGDTGRVLGEALPAAEVCFSTEEPIEPAAIRRLMAADLGDIADFAVLPANNRKKRLLISDMDSTIIGQECLDELAGFAGLKAEISEITERAMQGELDFEEALTERVAKLKGLSLDALKECYETRITLNEGARTLVETMKAAGARCVLVSGGFTYFTERVARAAGFHSHQGNTLIDDGKSLTGKVGRPILGKDAKREALEKECAALGLAPEDVLAIGDGANDLAMIEAAGLGVAYHAKPVVEERALAGIRRTDLRAALYFQGFEESDFQDAA